MYVGIWAGWELNTGAQFYPLFIGSSFPAAALSPAAFLSAVRIQDPGFTKLSAMFNAPLLVTTMRFGTMWDISELIETRMRNADRVRYGGSVGKGVNVTSWGCRYAQRSQHNGLYKGNNWADSWREKRHWVTKKTQDREDRVNEGVSEKVLRTMESMNNSIWLEGKECVGNEVRCKLGSQILKGFVYCAKQFGIYPKGSSDSGKDFKT